MNIFSKIGFAELEKASQNCVTFYCFFDVILTWQLNNLM